MPRLAAAVSVSAVLLTGCSATPPPAVAVREVAATPTALVVPTVAPTVPAPVPTRQVLTFGGDVSWPQCPLGTPGHLPAKPAKGLPMPGPDAQFVIIGLTNGPGFYPNPCLAWQVAHARERGLRTAAYAFTTLPNTDQLRRYGGKGPYPAGTALGRLRNASWAQAQVNLASLRRTGLKTPIVWMDIEPQPYLSPWGTDVARNRVAIRAMQQAYRDAGLRTGFYSSDNSWKSITGGMRDAGPTWVTAGPRGRAAAAAKCEAPTFSGGPAVLAQWWDGPREDLDLTCPRARGIVDGFFGR